MRIVIIEDEQITERDLERTLRSINSKNEIIRTLKSKAEAMEFFQAHSNIDLIFSDIQLGDGLSFEIFESIEIPAPIIYVTAFNEYALEAFKTYGIDYILKPFEKTSIESALDKLSNMKSVFSAKSEDFSELINLLKSNVYEPNPSSILIQKGDRIIPLKIAEIGLFYTEYNVVFAVKFNGTKYVASQKLSELEAIFEPKFFRANRQFLLNRKAVKDASQHFNRKLLVNLNFPFKEQILVGKLKTTLFLKWLQNS